MLAVDHYDHDPTTVSATTLLKPLRQIVLRDRVAPVNQIGDISNLIASRFGTALHDACEKAWVDHYREALEALGHPPSMIDRIVINPEGPVEPNAIPIYLEVRKVKEYLGYLIGGKFDLCMDGEIQDYKSTSAYIAQNDLNKEKYILQGSIYKWLNQDIVHADTLTIHFIVTDWSARDSKMYAGYPPGRMFSRTYPLMEISEIEKYMRDKINLINKYVNSPEEDIPECTDEELWQRPDSYKYYRDATKQKKSTKNFEDKASADKYHREDIKAKTKGVVVTFPGEVLACKYCDVISVCTQKDKLIQEGRLKI